MSIKIHRISFAQDAMAEFHTTYNDVASASELVRIVHEADGRAAKI